METRWVSHLSRALTVLRNINSTKLKLIHLVLNLFLVCCRTLQVLCSCTSFLMSWQKCSILSQVFQRFMYCLYTFGVSGTWCISNDRKACSAPPHNCVTECGCNTNQEVRLVGDHDEEFTAVKLRVIECILQFLSSRFTALQSEKVPLAGFDRGCALRILTSPTSVLQLLLVLLFQVQCIPHTILFAFLNHGGFGQS